MSDTLSLFTSFRKEGGRQMFVDIDSRVVGKGVHNDWYAVWARRIHETKEETYWRV